MGDITFYIRDIEKKDAGSQFDTGFKPFGIVKGHDYLNYKKETWNVRVVVLVDKKEKIIGVSVFRVKDKGIYLRRLGIDRGYHGKEIGKALLSDVIKFAEQENLEYIEIRAHQKVIKKCSDYGFDIISPIKYSPKWGDYVEMRLEIFRHGEPF